MSVPITPEVLGQLLDDYGGTLVLFASRWTNQAEDCVQEALVELARQARVPENAVAWLFHAVKYRALSAARKAQRRERHEAVVAARWIAKENHHAQSQQREIAEALESLPDDQREVVIARVWGGLGFEELGKLLGVSTATAHRHYETALVTLRERLGVICPPRIKN